MGDADEIKSRLNIIDVIGEKVVLKKAGRNFKGLCPFHNEKTPSFMVSPDRQVFHCFGCGKGGSVIDFVMEYEHMEFPEALEELAARAGVTLTKKKSDSPERKLKDALYEVNELASAYYHYVLTKHPLGEKALLYCRNRGISDKSIKTFGMGYSPNGWEGLYRFLRKKNYDDATIEKAGLVVRGTKGLYDRFRGRVMFTLRDHRGKAVGFSGRVLDPNIKEAKYINTSETLVYSKSNVLFGLDVTHEAITKANEAILMEGEVDVISSFQAGVSNVVAIKGSALTEGHVHLLRRYAEHVIFSLDSDMAGDSASRRGIEIAERAGLDMKVATLPSGKDPDEAVREDPVGFKKAMQQAISIYDYFIRSSVKRYDVTTAFGKKKASDELLPMLSKIDNLIVQGHYSKKVAEVLGVSEDTILDGMKRINVPIRDGVVVQKGTGRESFAISGPERLEVYCLGLLLQGDTYQLFDDLSRQVQIADMKHLGVRHVLEELERYKGKEEPFQVQEFAKTLPKELLPVLDEAYLWDLAHVLDDSVLFTKEWKRTVREVEKSILRRKMRDVTDRIKGASEEESQRLQEELLALTSSFSLLEKNQ